MRSPESKGFTLVELMVIIALMGVIALMATPSVTSFVASSRLAGATNTLIGDLRYARVLSTSQRRTYEVRSSTNGYALVCVSPEQTVFSRALPTGVTIPSPDTTTFFSWGLTETAAITLSQGSHSRLVQMTASGQVSHD